MARVVLLRLHLLLLLVLLQSNSPPGPHPPYTPMARCPTDPSRRLPVVVSAALLLHRRLPRLGPQMVLRLCPRLSLWQQRQLPRCRV